MNLFFVSPRGLSLLLGTTLVMGSAIAQTTDSEESRLVFSVGAAQSNLTARGIPSEKSRWGPLLGVDYSYGRFFAGTQRGIGYEVIKTKNFNAFASLFYSVGRKEGTLQDGPRFRGMGKIKPSGQVMVGFDWAPIDELLSFNSVTSVSIERGQGFTSAFGASIGFPILDTLSGSLNISTTYGDRKYAQTYYGVTAAQSARSGNAAYNAKAGFFERQVSLGLEYKINPQWSANGSLGRITRTGNAAKSPLYTRRGEPTAAIALNYVY